jgi:diadenylate cyclase
MNSVPHHFWSWVVEITLLSMGLYYTWKLFHGTRGEKVLIGLALFLISMTGLSYLLHLTVIDKILSEFSTFFIIALVVIFQPELRRILAELGSGHAFSTTRQQSEVIEAVVNAITTLQKEKLGALIAFERDVSYQPGRETGTELDARVSEDILATIFYPKTPLHDGGVVIQRDRIVAAAAIFPLTQQEGLERTLGLRHRAALGLSEETDAVVVVLSEETGIISIAQGGRLQRPLDSDQLRTALTELLTG